MTLHPVHALSAAELTTLRTRIPEQSTDIRLAVWPKIPDSVVWEARVTLPLPASDDMVYQINYDGGGAGFANTIRDQTVWIGSAARSYDRGIVRLREAAPGVAGILKIGETSEIVWTDNDYITVVDEFGLWPRHAYISGAGVLFMDREVAYTDQNEYPDPVPVLLPDEVIEYDGVLGGAVTVNALFDASDSWALDGGALTYSWVAPGASATAGMATATPTITYNSAGVFRVACTVTRDYGGGNIKTFTGYRHVHIFDDNNLPVTQFILDNCSGDWSSGGWSFTVTLEDEARRTEIVDRARLILFAKDNTSPVGPIYSDTHGLLRANILAIGWIAGETIDWDNEKGTVEFEVQGPQFWFDKMTAFPHGLEDYDGSPTTWLEFNDFEVRKGDWSFLHWHTTATRMMDVYVPIDDARQIRQFSAPGSSSLWAQMTRVNESAILAHPACDRYGRLWIQRPLSLLFLAERAGTPSVIDIARQDWRDQISIERRIVDEVSAVDGSGIGYLDGVADPYYMLALGHIYKRYGSVDTLERLALFRNQNTNNTLIGLVMDYLNNPYPNVDVRFAGYYRAFDIVPHQRLLMTILEADTERGIEWTDRQLVPMMVSFTHDWSEGVLEVDATLQAETFGVAGITGDPPPSLPPVPTTPPTPPSPPVEPPPPPVNYGVAVSCRDQMAISFNFFDQLSPDWYDLDPNANLVGTIYGIAIGSNLEAYCTTRDLTDVNLTGTGLWYTPDITNAVDASLVWTLIVPVDGPSPSAVADTGYNNVAQKPCFGSLFIKEDDTCCALVHSAGNFPPPAGQTGIYICTGGVPAYQNLPLRGGVPVFQHQPFNRTLHAVWGWGGNFFVCGGGALIGWRGLIEEIGVGLKVDFDPPDTTVVKGAHQGYFVSGNIVAVPPNSNVFGAGSWNAGVSEVLTIEVSHGIVTDYMGVDTSLFLYWEDDGLFDLYVEGVGLIGDASAEFGVAMLGGYASFYPLDTDQIVWVVGTQAAFASNNIVIYTDDQGATWISKDGVGATSLQNALGGAVNWNGWTNSNTGNSLAMVFSY